MENFRIIENPIGAFIRADVGGQPTTLAGPICISEAKILIKRYDPTNHRYYDETCQECNNSNCKFCR